MLEFFIGTPKYLSMEAERKNLFWLRLFVIMFFCLLYVCLHFFYDRQAVLKPGGVYVTVIDAPTSNVGTQKCISSK